MICRISIACPIKRKLGPVLLRSGTGAPHMPLVSSHLLLPPPLAVGGERHRAKPTWHRRRIDQELEAVAPMAQHLLAAADRYGMDRLKVLCEGKLSCGITIDTAATSLALAEQHNCVHLRAKCVEFIISTPAILDAVVATDGYRHLEASCPSALTSILLSVRGRRY